MRLLWCRGKELSQSIALNVVILVMGWLGRALVARSRRDAAATHRYSKKVLDHWGAHNSRLKIVQLAETLAVNSI